MPHRPSEDYFSAFLSELRIALAHKDAAAKSFVLAIIERCKAKTPVVDSSHADCMKFDDWGRLESFLAKLTGKEFKKHVTAMSRVRDATGARSAVDGGEATPCAKPHRRPRSATPCDRSVWPKHVSVRTFLKLSSRVPSGLIERELFVSSICAEERLMKELVFARSLATSSIAGHVVGLGDRHLDNILLDLKTGSVMHVDLSIAFGRGMYDLRVAEVVPFRLTRVLRGALGLSREDGVFRAACESSLQAIKMGQELVTSLLLHTETNSSSVANYKSGLKRRVRSDEVSARLDGKLRYPHDFNDEGEGVRTATHSTEVGDDEKYRGSVTVSEHVTRLITAATNVDNLACMFEGWAAWI